MELNKEQKEALRRFLVDSLDGSRNIADAVYVSPAQQLRNQANKIEQRERDYPFLREILGMLKD